MNIKKEVVNVHELLILGYSRNTCIDTTPIDIIKIIYLYFQIVFDFEIIDAYLSTKDVIEIHDIQLMIEDDEYADDSSDVEDVPAIIISVNSGSIKVGFAGEDAPLILIPNIIAKDKDGNVSAIGYEAKDKPNISCPIECGDIIDWDGFKAIILRVFSKIIEYNNAQNNTEDQFKYPVLITKCIGFSKETTEKMSKFMFKQVGADSLYICPRAFTAMYASGRPSGIILLSDYHCTEIVPIYENSIIEDAVIKLDIGRRDVLRYIEHCDENKFQHKNDAFDIMYDPKLCGKDEYDGIHECVYKALMKCDPEYRNDRYFSRIVLIGLNTIDFDGIYYSDGRTWSQRIEKEVKANTECPKDWKFYVNNSVERYWSVWIGASIIASLRTFDSLCMTKDEYQKQEVDDSYQ